MELLFSHKQEKIYKKIEDGKSCCDLKLYRDNDFISYVGLFDVDYKRYGDKKHVTYEYHIDINIINGDIETYYKITNDSLRVEQMFRSMNSKKKNDFSMLYDNIDDGLIRGQRRYKFWGVNYNRAIDKIFKILLSILQPQVTSEFLKNKEYGIKPHYNEIYDLLVDFHIDKKGIKSPDDIYTKILNDYPKKKWLKKNEFKFIPAILDEYGIKSKHLIGELNQKSGKMIHISTLSYICKLFGEGYIDYIKKIKWDLHCFDKVPNKKIHILRNESEKNSMVDVINNWESNTLLTESFVYNVNKLLGVREFLEKNGFTNLKFKAKDDIEFETLLEMWVGMKQHLNRGYKIRYLFPDNFIQIIEEEIKVDDKIFKPKILISEEDYRLEGYMMRNCMSKQFIHGTIYVYVSLQYNKKRINLQYRKGQLIQSLGKANTAVIDIFEEPVKILTQRFVKFPSLEWKKERYDIIEKK